MYEIWSWHTYNYAFDFLLKTGCDTKEIVPSISFATWQALWVATWQALWVIIALMHRRICLSCRCNQYYRSFFSCSSQVKLAWPSQAAKPLTLKPSVSTAEPEFERPPKNPRLWARGLAMMRLRPAADTKTVHGPGQSPLVAGAPAHGQGPGRQHCSRP